MLFTDSSILNSLEFEATLFLLAITYEKLSCIIQVESNWALDVSDFSSIYIYIYIYIYIL